MKHPRFDSPMAMKRHQLAELALEKDLTISAVSVRTLRSAGILLELLGHESCPLGLPAITFDDSDGCFIFLWGPSPGGAWVSCNIHRTFLAVMAHEKNPVQNLNSDYQHVGTLPLTRQNQDDLKVYQECVALVVYGHRKYLGVP